MLMSLWAIATAQTAEPPLDPQLADIVVTARPAPLAPLLTPVAYLRRHCFDPLRLTGRFSPPVDDADWRELEPEIARRFGQADGGAPAYGLTDPKRGHTLLIRFERSPGRKGLNLVEDRCTLAVIGGEGHARLVDAMAGLFRASGTQRHVGARDGVPALPGWRQWMWSGMPNRRSSAWTALKAGGRGTESARLVVFDPDFYDEFQYVLGDLKSTSDGTRPVSVLTLSRTRRADANEKGRPLAGPPLRRVQTAEGQKSR